MRAWMVEQILGLSIVQQPTARPAAPRLGWPGGCPTAPPMACPRHVAPPHPAVLAHVSRGASRFSCARPARGGAHVGKAVPCSLGGPREAVSGCLRDVPVTVMVTGGRRPAPPTVHVDAELRNKIGEADVSVIYLGATVMRRMTGVTNLIIQSSDTDVWVATLAALDAAPAATAASLSSAHIYVHRPAADELINIKQTQEVLEEMNIMVPEFTYLFCLGGCDFTSGIGGFSHKTLLKHYIQHQQSGNQIGSLVTESATGELQYNTTAWQRMVCSLYYEIPKVKGAKSAAQGHTLGGAVTSGATRDRAAGVRAGSGYV
jgi:hypothetical protein